MSKTSNLQKLSTLKIWLAEKKEKFNTKFISGQHGGYFFTNKFMFHFIL